MVAIGRPRTAPLYSCRHPAFCGAPGITCAFAPFGFCVPHHFHAPETSKALSFRPHGWCLWR